jgi:hypothetical protein
MPSVSHQHLQAVGNPSVPDRLAGAAFFDNLRAIAPDIGASAMHHPILKLSLISAGVHKRPAGKDHRARPALLLEDAADSHQGSHLSLLGKVRTPCECIEAFFVSPS